jgi:hypothetical protein
VQDLSERFERGSFRHKLDRAAIVIEPQGPIAARMIWEWDRLTLLNLCNNFSGMTRIVDGK